MNYKPSKYNYLTQLTNGKTVLYNFFSNGLAEVEEKDVDRVQQILKHCNDEIDGYMAEIKDYLIENSYLIPSDLDEIDLIRNRNMSKRFDQRYHGLTVMPTLDCNFACTYCYETREKGFISRNGIKGIKNWIRTSSSKGKHVNLSWFGGEPLLDFSIIEEVNRFAVQICTEYNCQFQSQITTNAYLLTEEIIRKIDDLHIKQIQITMDGMPEYHNRFRPLRNGEGTFDVVFSNILKVLDQTKTTINLRVNVNKENYHSITGFMDLIPKPYRIPRLKIYFRNIFQAPDHKKQNQEVVEHITSDHQSLRKLYLYALEQGFFVQFPIAFLKDYHCQTCLKNNYVLHPSGTIFKCSVGYELEKKVGEIRSNGDLDLDYGVLSKWLSHVPGDDPKCRECILLPLCQGGCRYLRLIGKQACPYEISDLPGIIEMIYFYTVYGCSEG